MIGIRRRLLAGGGLPLTALVGNTEPPVEISTDIVGDFGEGGAGNWPTSADRAVLAPFELPHRATLTNFIMRVRAGSAAGNRYRGLMYAADGADGKPGTLLAATAPSEIIPGGFQIIMIPANREVVEAQTVWIGYVCDGAASAQTDSGGTNAAQTIMFNGTLSFASPPTTAPVWPGSPGPYSNVPSVSFEYEYEIVPNRPPVAAFTFSVAGLTATFTNTSTDSDGTIVETNWDFGDGNTSTESSPVHTYSEGGSYSVQLTVVDDDNGFKTRTRTVTVAPAANLPPTADFTYTVNQLEATFTSTSTDSDGSIADYSWDFGDGSVSTEAAPTHAFAEPGTYSVTLEVTDNSGASASVTHDVLVTNEAPAEPEVFGNVAALTGSSPGSSGRAYVSRFNMPMGGEISKLTMTSGTGTLAGSNGRLFVMSDNAGAPGSILAISASQPIPAGVAAIDFPVSITLPMGDYWLGVVFSDFQGRLGTSAGGTGTMLMANGDFPFNSAVDFAWPSTAASYDMLVGINATYTPAVGECGPQPPDEVRVLVCPMGQDGVWEQTRSYVPAEWPACWVPGEWTDSVNTCQLLVPPEGELLVDTSYVDTGSPQYARFMGYVDDAVAGDPEYAFCATDAVTAYLLDGDVAYANLAVAMVEDQVATAEAAIALGNRPRIAGDSYLEVGPMLTDLALTYHHCNSLLTTEQKARWAGYARQTCYNVWHPATAAWGGEPATWTGWSIDDPGNNYHYSFISATMYWALASNDTALLNFLTNNKLPALEAYMDALVGGGSLEGTGYGLAHRSMFMFYQCWKDNGRGDLANENGHLDGTIRFWIHGTMPTRDLYQPIGDLSRIAWPSLFDYHRELVLKARRLTLDPAVDSAASWWLNNISVTQMTQPFQYRHDLIPPGSNTTTPPTELTYYAEGTGNLFCRTGWGTSDAYAHIIAGPYNQSHAHQNQGAFTFFKGGFLAVTNNIYSSSGITQSVVSQNVLRFNTGATLIPQTNGTSVMEVISRNDATGETHATMNIKPCIASPAVTAWDREFHFVDGELTIHDTYACQAGTTATFMLNTPEEPSVVGNVITAGNLRVTVTTPASPTIAIVDMTTQTAPDDNSTFTDGWRIDISGGTGEYEVTLEAIA